MKDLSKLQVFTRGFLQDTLTLMAVMHSEEITKEDIKRYIKEHKKSEEKKQFSKPVENPKPIDFTRMRVSEKYKIFKEKNPDSNMTIEEFITEIRAGRVPCKGCRDKEKAMINGDGK